MTATHRHAIYEGQVTHYRAVPTSHAFQYRINFLFLDLDHLDSAFAGRWLWSVHRPNFAWVRRADHVRDATVSWVGAVRALVAASGIEATGRVQLLTQPRYLGFVMNPVSFYFCYDASDELKAVVAEVNNTPWGEQHCYVLPASAPNQELWLDKQFHVSPFMPMDIRYRWQIAPPGEQLALSIDNYRGTEKIFSAALSLRRRNWSAGELRRALLLYPLMTQRIYAGIYWQALQLWWKKTPYFPHPGQIRTNPVKKELACSDRG